MKHSIAAVLNRWAGSRWAWLPWLGGPPGRGHRIGWGRVGVHAVAGGVLSGAAAMIGIRLVAGGWSWSVGQLGTLWGGVAALLGGMMMGLAWKRREEEVPGPTKVRLTAGQRWVTQPLICAAIAAAAALVAGAVENVLGAWAYRQYRAELAARGEKLNIRELVPAPIPDSDNLARIPLYEGVLEYRLVPPEARTNGVPVEWTVPDAVQRAGRLGLEWGRITFREFAGSRKRTDDDWRNGVRLDLALWSDYLRESARDPRVRTAPAGGSGATGAKGVLEGLATAAEEERALLHREAAARKGMQFAVHWEEGFGALLPHLAVLKGQAAYLRLRAVALLAENRAEEALEEVRLAFRLSDGIRPDPLLIGALVRMAMDMQTLQAVWEGCLDRKWTEPQLAAVEGLLATRDYFGDTAQALRGERAVVHATFEAMLTRWGGLARQMDEIGSESLPDLHRLALGLLPSGWIRRNQVVHGRYLQGLIDVVAGVRVHGEVPDLDARVIAMKQRPEHFLAAMLVPALGSAVDRTFEGQVRCDLARVGVALERHRLAAGTYPESLEALVPRFLGEVPMDRMDGRPLRYRLEKEAGYRLHSVGLDHGDDGGQPPVRRSGRNGTQEAGDLVWRN